jgi:AbrB family looped-hinge helix DNA binding protein
MKYSCKVNPKGQITIPSQIRKKLEIKEDDILLAEITEEGVVILEGGSIKIDKNKEMLLRLLEETFATLKKREEGVNDEG